MKKYYILITSLLLLAFTTADVTSRYKVPREAASVCAADIDLDGDMDLIIGHKTAWGNLNPTVTILRNYNLGIFEILDTSLVYCGYQEYIFTSKINIDNYPDIITFHSDFSNGITERYIRILINNYGEFSNYYDINLNKSSVFSDLTYGDIDGDGIKDLITLSNIGEFWGILYNNGNNTFSAPEYHNLNYYPQNIVTGDLNNDGRDDIVIGGNTEIYYSKETGFQNQHLNGTTSHVLIADMDNDGDNDIIGLFDLFGIKTDITLFENKGSETFEKHEIAHPSFGSVFSVVTDFNNDTLPDLMILPPSNNGVYIFYNTGTLGFESPQFIEIPNQGEAYRKATVADLDNNGYNDIVIVRRTGPNANTYKNVIILFNDGKGNFVAEPPESINEVKNPNKPALFCYPNPFQKKLNIEYQLNKTEKITVDIYNMQGQKIKTIIKQKTRPPGKYQIIWNDTDKNRGSGINRTYLIRLQAGRQIMTRTVVKIN